MAQAVSEPVRVPYGVWHTGLFHGVENGKPRVIHAAPGNVVKVQPLERISFDGLYVLRLGNDQRCH